MITVTKATRRYGQVVAVNDVSVSIGAGEIVGLLGHNGAGKTTLMKMLTGYLEPTSGTLTVGGKDVVASRVEAQKQIGYLPENAPLYPEMLVQEYLFMMAELRGVDASKRDEAVGRAAASAGLGDHLVRPISELSKGYRQRVGIAQAILHDPDVLVLDEPTNGLDPVQIQSIRDLIKRLAQNTTIILSTHILQEVEAVCDRVLVMIDGTLAADSPLQDMLASSTIQLALAQGTTGVDAKLRGIDSVQEVRNIGPTPGLAGYETWNVTCTEGANPSHEILKAGMGAGWTIGSIAPEHLTLDGVFKRLQQEHISRARPGATS